MNVLITGGAGFIGSSLVRKIMAESDHNVINIDKLTYAGNLSSIKSASDSSRYKFVRGDICDNTLMIDTFEKFQPDLVIHLAAESHVDRSIKSPTNFIQTNIFGTFSLLEVARQYFHKLEPIKKSSFRFLHVSTDEVYGSLEKNGFFTETSAYDPSSPYSASKASSDHLVRAWHRTFDLPTIITNCSNNYGPYQHPEKLIPLMILNALNKAKLPIYGDGTQVRDWLYVEDHASALYQVALNGKVGETYNIGGHNEKTNLEVVNAICEILDNTNHGNLSVLGTHKELISFVDDRPGHDQRYAIDPTKIETELNWKPKETFESGLEKTIEWYISNREWCSQIQLAETKINVVREGFRS